MFLSRLAATGLLFSSASYIGQNSRQQPAAECEGSRTGEQSVEDLDKIFAGQDGGLPPDAEEIQEMILKAQGKSIRYASIQC